MPLDGLAAGEDVGDLEALGAEGVNEGVGDGGFVFDEEHLHGARETREGEGRMKMRGKNGQDPVPEGKYWGCGISADRARVTRRV